MPSFSKASLEELKQCKPQLQRLLDEAIKHFDFKVIEGHRGKEAQEEAVRLGYSKVHWPHGNHNHKDHPENDVDQPISRAVDIAPWPVRYNDIERFVYLAGHIKGIAAVMGIGVRWGGDWDQDTQVTDERFRDYGHFELVDH